MEKQINRDLVINFLRGEFIGKEVEIIDSKNKDLIGIKGKIVDETKNMFEVEIKEDTRRSNGAPFLLRKKEGTKKMQKKVCRFKFIKEKIVVDGSIINFRPEDRISRKFRDW